jgi:hypothetical protein
VSLGITLKEGILIVPELFGKRAKGLIGEDSPIGRHFEKVLVGVGIVEHDKIRVVENKELGSPRRATRCVLRKSSVRALLLKLAICELGIFFSLSRSIFVSAA